MNRPMFAVGKESRARLALAMLLVFTAGQSQAGELCKVFTPQWAGGKTVAFSSTPYEQSDRNVRKKTDAFGGYEKDKIVEPSCVEGVKVFNKGTPQEKQQKSGFWYMVVEGLAYTNALDTDNSDKVLDPPGKENQFEFTGQNWVQSFKSEEACKEHVPPYKDFTSSGDRSVLFVMEVFEGNMNYSSYFYPASCHSFIKVFEHAQAAGRCKTVKEYVAVLKKEAKEADTTPVVRPIKSVKNGRLVY